MFGVLTLYQCEGRSRSDEELMLKTSAFQIFHSGNLNLSNSFHKTEFSCYCSLLWQLAVSFLLLFMSSQHHSFTLISVKLLLIYLSLLFRLFVFFSVISYIAEIKNLTENSLSRKETDFLIRFQQLN